MDDKFPPTIREGIEEFLDIYRAIMELLGRGNRAMNQYQEYVYEGDLRDFHDAFLESMNNAGGELISCLSSIIQKHADTSDHEWAYKEKTIAKRKLN